MKPIAHKNEALRCARCFVLARRGRMNGIGGHHAGPVPILIYVVAPPVSRTSVAIESGDIAAVYPPSEPFVEGISSLARGSIATAVRSARARPLKHDSAIW